MYDVIKKFTRAAAPDVVCAVYEKRSDAVEAAKIVRESVKAGGNNRWVKVVVVRR